jgi:Tol biopolymer transport system component
VRKDSIVRRLLAGATCAALLLAAAATAAAPGDKGFERGHRPILLNIAVNSDFKEQAATVDPAGQDLRQLTHFNAGAGEAQWAPNGGRIVVERFRNGRPGLLYSMRAGGKGLRRLSSGCHNRCLEDFEPAWSNGGRLIAFNRAFGPVVDDTASEIDLMIMRRNGNDIRVIERFGNLVGKRRFEPHNPDFSPDDRQLALTLLDVSSPKGDSAIFTYTFATGEFDRVTPWRLNAGNADWAASGRRILFNSNYLAPGPTDLYTIGPDGSGVRRLTNYPGNRSAFAPTWSPSNRRVAFSVAGPGVPPHPVVMNVGGENKHRVTRKTGIVLDWG